MLSRLRQWLKRPIVVRLDTTALRRGDLVVVKLLEPCPLPRLSTIAEEMKRIADECGVSLLIFGSDGFEIDIRRSVSSEDAPQHSDDSHDER